VQEFFLLPGSFAAYSDAQVLMEAFAEHGYTEQDYNSGALLTMVFVPECVASPWTNRVDLFLVFLMDYLHKARMRDSNSGLEPQ
jgi:hypothetical protein